MTVENTSVIDAHFFHLAGKGVLTLLDECLCHSRYIGDAAVEPDGGVDTVGK